MNLRRFLIAESLRNVEKGDQDAAGFYNIGCKASDEKRSNLRKY